MEIKKYNLGTKVILKKGLLVAVICGKYVRTGADIKINA